MGYAWRGVELFLSGREQSGRIYKQCSIIIFVTSDTKL
jgi:hypothetical protein